VIEYFISGEESIVRVRGTLHVATLDDQNRQQPVVVMS